MSEIELAANASTEAGFATQEPDVQVSLPVEDTVPAPQAPTEAPKGDVTQTQAFAKRLREERAKAAQEARDAVVAEIYGSQGITTEKALREAQEREKLLDEGKDPETEFRIRNLETELRTYRQQETFARQDATLRKDPIKGSLYSKWADEVRDSATEWGVDLSTAFTVILEAKLPEIISGTATQAEQAALQKLQTNATATPGSLSAPADNSPKGIADLSANEFEQMVQRAKRGELRK